ncbi:MATE family efflux transporter [Pontibacter arcticus]|uniref:Membrane protein involved in the export of O-antigen and teichoic acid n=1 Tax=Pontibacter arcticus TaxID=2080288 RepID=A0A364RF73_9BACT|nr:hypothetical protein [Pontibacter arcticus]RAU82990.1 hypothetical protein DP923_07055 [Pontibacter arcticus]
MYLNKLSRYLNIDQDILYSIALKLWSVIKTPLSFYFITQYLTIDEQGYWYTFINLGALSVFAELGFTTIITQYVSHEFAHLELNRNKRLTGSSEALEKIISLIKFTFKVYSYLIPLGIIILSFVGVLFFSKYDAYSSITLAWIVYAFTGGLTLLVSYVGALLQGLDKVKEVLKINLISGFLSVFSIWISLYFNLKLWALSVGGFVLIISTLVLYINQLGPLYFQISKFKIKTKFSWFKEIMPLQIKFSLSWISSYFVFYFAVPITMYFLGAEEAGRLGISISITTAMLHLAHAWISTKTPLLNMLVSKREFGLMDQKFNSLHSSSIIVFIVISIILLLIYIYIFPIFTLNYRFLTLLQLSILLCAELPKLIYGNLAVYLRAFKVEPFLHVSIITAILTVVALVIGLYFFESLTTGLILYMIVQYVALFAGLIIFRNFKNNRLKMVALIDENVVNNS